MAQLKIVYFICSLFLVVFLPLQSHAAECTSFDGDQLCMATCTAPYPDPFPDGNAGCLAADLDLPFCCGNNAIFPLTSPDSDLANVDSFPRLESLIMTSATTTIANITRGLLGLAGTLTVIMMIYGGVLLMTASGNDKAVGKAKQIIVWTAIGLVLIFSSYAILTFIFNNLAV